MKQRSALSTVLVITAVSLFLAVVLCFLFVWPLRYMSRWYADSTDNVDLTDFSKGLISLYLEDSLYVNFCGDDDEITLISVSDDDHIWLLLWGNDSDLYEYICHKCFTGDYPYLGKTRFEERSIRVFGVENPMFFSVHGEAPKQPRCKEEWWEYDPIVWEICFNRDSSFCREKTRLCLESLDITPIEQLVAREKEEMAD